MRKEGEKWGQISLTKACSMHLDTDTAPRKTFIPATVYAQTRLHPQCSRVLFERKMSAAEYIESVFCTSLPFLVLQFAFQSQNVFVNALHGLQKSRIRLPGRIFQAPILPMPARQVRTRHIASHGDHHVHRRQF